MNRNLAIIDLRCGSPSLRSEASRAFSLGVNGGSQASELTGSRGKATGDSQTRAAPPSMRALATKFVPLVSRCRSRCRCRPAVGIYAWPRSRPPG